MEEVTTIDRYVWVIKDNNGCFVHGLSIYKTNPLEWAYVPHETFSDVCRAYIERHQAGVVMEELNKLKVMAGFDVIFHLEKCAFSKMIKQGKQIRKAHNTSPNDDKIYYSWILKHHKLASVLAFALFFVQSLHMSVA